MPVNIKRNLDRAVAHEALYLFRVIAVLDPQRRAGVAQRVHPVLPDHDHFGLSCFVEDGVAGIVQNGAPIRQSRCDKDGR